MIGGTIVGADALAYPTLRNKVQGYLHETEIEKALLPIIYQAICMAYKLSEESVEAGDKLLDGVSKAAVADCIYDLLPTSIGGIPPGIIKTLVSREKFAQFVEQGYQTFDANYHLWLEDMDKALEAWEKVNQPAA